jgi:hypothetical protein
VAQEAKSSYHHQHKVCISLALICPADRGQSDLVHHNLSYSTIVYCLYYMYVANYRKNFCFFSIGTEGEEAIYSQRSKVYKFDADAKQWKERGVGEMKILKHKAQGECDGLHLNNGFTCNQK